MSETITPEHDRDDRTNQEIVYDELQTAADPLTLSDLDSRIPDVNRSSISAALTNLHHDGKIDRDGDGGHTDPYRYHLPGAGGDTTDDTGDDGGRGNDALDTLFTDEHTDDDTDLHGIFDNVTDDTPEPDDTDDVQSTAFEHTEHDYTVLPDDTPEPALAFGERYWAKVNGTKDYGIFAQLTTGDGDTDEISGLCHVQKFPQLYEPDEFEVGDEIGVMLVARNENGLEFEAVAALDTLRNHRFERDPDYAPLDDRQSSTVPTFDDLSNKERTVTVAVHTARNGVSEGVISNWLLNYPSVGTTLRNLWKKGVVECDGRGVKGDPYKYSIADDFEVPDDHTVDLPDRPDRPGEKKTKYESLLNRAKPDGTEDEPTVDKHTTLVEPTEPTTPADMPDDTDDTAADTDDEADEQSNADKMRETIRNADEPLTVSQVADRIGIDYRPSTDLKWLVDNDDFERIGAGMNTDPYRYYHPDEHDVDTDDTDYDAGPTAKERTVAVLEAADGPLTASQVADYVGFNYKPSRELRELYDAGHVNRVGGGVKGDPYRFYVDGGDPTDSTDADETTPRDHAVECLRQADSDELAALFDDAGIDTDDAVGVSKHDFVIEYVRQASGDERADLWDEVADVFVDLRQDTDATPAPDELPDGIVVGLPEADWVDLLFGVGDSHLSHERTRELITTVGRHVWGDGTPPERGG